MGAGREEAPGLRPADAAEPGVLAKLREGGRWEFDAPVTEAFEAMLRRSIPQLEVMRATVTDLASMVIDRGFEAPTGPLHVVDLGCSRGDALAPLIERYGARLRYVGVDVAEPMLAAARERFAGWAERGVVDIARLDLRTGYPAPLAVATLAVLTLMFIPPEHRLRVVRRAYERTARGGALIVVEKVQGASALIDELFDGRYLRLKAEHGYSAEEIERKKLSLEGVLMPYVAVWNEDLLRRAGFDEVDCFWRWCNFAGWIALKE